MKGARRIYARRRGEDRRIGAGGDFDLAHETEGVAGVE
jgi:hypothetical protein